jgi:hypothetical protein
MRNPVTGIVHGNSISLDEPVPEFEGGRVRLLLVPVEQATAAPSAQEQELLWRQWTENGPDGPIEDEDGPEFP